MIRPFILEFGRFRYRMTSTPMSYSTAIETLSKSKGSDESMQCVLPLSENIPEN